MILETSLLGVRRWRVHHDILYSLPERLKQEGIVLDHGVLGYSFLERVDSDREHREAAVLDLGLRG